MKFRNLLAGLAAVTASMFVASCKVPGNVSYFQDDTALVANIQKTPLKLQPGNKVKIRVKSKDDVVNTLFNVVEGNNEPVSYTVSEEGTIDFPILGNVMIGGMTRDEVAGYIKGELAARQLVKNPSVIVDFDNVGVSVLGEVTTPGPVEIKGNTLTLLEALSAAGDLTLNGRRDNVKVIREENGQYRTYTVNLMNLKETASSPVFSLRDRDVIYVEPNDLRKRQTTVNGNNVYNAGFWISVASLCATLATTVGVYVNK